jgi:hypothetical protein
VFAGESNETESCLVRVEFEYTTERLLSHCGQIVGIVEEHPGDCVRYGTNTTNKFGQTLTNSGDATVICRTQTEGHRGLMLHRNSLTLEMFGYPGIRQHRFANSRWTT